MKKFENSKIGKEEHRVITVHNKKVFVWTRG
jgi:hypothetical protein